MNEAAGNLFFNFTADCAAAWLAHQFGPHLPRLRFIRKYLSWIPVVILTVPAQFVVYESYVITRPWYAFGLIYLFPLVAATWYVIFEASAIKYESQIQRGHLLFKYPRLRKLAVPLLVFLPFAYVAFIGEWLYYHYQPPKKNVIIVARFSGAEPEKYSPTPELLRALKRLSESAGDLEVLPSHTEITPEDGSPKAASLGRALIGTRNNATVVVWGWYAVIEGRASITGNLEFGEGVSLPSYAKAHVTPSGEGYDLREIRYQVPLEKLDLFKLQADAAGEVRARCSYVLALVLISAGRYQKAKDLLDMANLGPDQDLQDAVLSPAPKAKPYEHSSNGPAVDYLESASDSANKSRFSGKWRVLVARAYTDIALGLSDRALLDCAQAALLSKESVTYVCLGQAHLKRAERATDLSTQFLEAKRATEDCSVAAQLETRFSNALGCRADASLLLASATWGTNERPKTSPAVKGFFGSVQPFGSLGKIGLLSSGRGVETLLSLEDWNHYIETNPSDYYGFLRRGEAYHGLGRDVEAEADYSRALALNPKAVVAYNNRGALRLQNAIAAASTRPADASASSFERALSTQALTDLRSAVKLSPHEASAWCNLGEAARISDQYRLAKDSFQRCESLAADDSMRSWASQRLPRTPVGIETRPAEGAQPP